MDLVRIFMDLVRICIDLVMLFMDLVRICVDLVRIFTPSWHTDAFNILEYLFKRSFEHIKYLVNI